MKNNWQKTVNRINHELYRIPEGWDTKEQVAASLECDPQRVADILKPGIASGDIERQEFPVWDVKRRMAVRVTCYRESTGEAPAAKPCVAAKKEGALEARVRQAVATYPGKTDAGLARNLNGVSSSQVREIRQRLGI